MSRQIVVVVVPPPGLGLRFWGGFGGFLGGFLSEEEELDSVEMVSRLQMGQREGPGGFPVQE